MAISDYYNMLQRWVIKSVLSSHARFNQKWGKLDLIENNQSRKSFMQCKMHYKGTRRVQVPELQVHNWFARGWVKNCKRNVWVKISWFVLTKIIFELQDSLLYRLFKLIFFVWYYKYGLVYRDKVAYKEKVV